MDVCAPDTGNGRTAVFEHKLPATTCLNAFELLAGEGLEDL